jgi:DNA-binding response OmpR family regulator/ligand-binding sensor domain-containing protein/two-component sensor histidine kinase
VNFSEIISFFINRDDKLRIVTQKGGNFCYRTVRNQETGEISLLPEDDRTIVRKPLIHCFYENESIYSITPDGDFFVYDLKNNKENFICNLQKEIQSRGVVSSIIRHHDDYFIGFKMKGLIHLKKNEADQSFHIRNININCGIFCLAKDRFQDILWIGTDGQGVYIYSDISYAMRSTVLNNLTLKMECPVRAIFLDDDQTLWIGSKGDGILKLYDYCFDKNVDNCDLEVINSKNSRLQNNAVYCFEKSGNNVLWIGNEEGLCYYSYREKKIKPVNIEIKGKAFRYIHDIHLTKNGEIWLASVGMGVARAHVAEVNNEWVLKDVKRYFINEDDFASNYFFSIYAENDSVFYFGNRGYGPFRYHEASDRLEPANFYKNNKIQTINDVFAIEKDRAGDYLFGTGYGLVKYFSKGNYTIFNSKNGFLNNSIHAILKGEDDTFWLSTNRGIIAFDSRRNVFQTFDLADGLKIVEFSDGAAFNDAKNGVLFFGGINGFLAVRKSGKKSQNYMPTILFHNLTIFGNFHNIFEKMTKKKGEQILHLKSNENFFSISFTAIDYLNGSNYVYSYKLEELSDQWISNRHSNVASFTNLSPGEYTLQVKYDNRTLGLESPIYSMIIKIAYPWYRSFWAYCFYCIAAGTAIYFLARYSILKKNQKKQKLLNELDKKHQKEVYESKLCFFTNIAHEFCTPLTLISGPCERILAHLEVDKFVVNYVKMIQANANRLNNLICELIEFRKIETGNRKPQIETLSISALIKEISGLFFDMAESKNISLDIHVDENVSCNSDKGFLTTIIINLLSNAFKYTPNGKKINVRIFADKEQLWIKIANQGKLINEKDYKRIFDRYVILDNFEKQDSKQTFSRNGLGLAISYNMIRLLNGNIRVENTPEQWVLFTVNLPNLPVNTTKPSKQNHPGYIPVIESPPAIKLPDCEIDKLKPTILLIDDETEILWFMCEIFSKDFNAITLQEPQYINSILNEITPNVIICDVMMPSFNGIDLIKKLKFAKETSHIPVIFVSGKYEMEYQIEAMEAGAEMYITKPFNAEYLKISVLQIINRKEKLMDYFNSPQSLYELMDGKPIFNEQKRFFHAVLKVIANNIENKDLSIQMIADELDMAERTLFRKIKNIGEQTPNNLVKECRLLFAKNLLLKTNMSIDEIIFKSGFANRVTFFQAFSKKYGDTPQKYRMKQEEV